VVLLLDIATAIALGAIAIPIVNAFYFAFADFRETGQRGFIYPMLLSAFIAIDIMLWLAVHELKIALGGFMTGIVIGAFQIALEEA